MPTWRNIFYLVLACITSFIVSFHRTNPTILYDEMATYTDKNDTLMGIYGSTYFFIGAISTLITIILLSKIKTVYILLIFLLTSSIGILLIVFSKNFALLCISRAIIGFGFGPINFLLVLISRLSNDNRSAFVFQCLIYLFDMFGSMFTVGPFSSIILHIDWHDLFFISAIVTICLSVLFLFLTPRTTSQPFNSLSATTPSNILSINLIDDETNPSSSVTFTSPSFWLPTLWFVFTVSGTLNISCMWGNPYLMNYFAFTGLEAGYIQVSLFLGAIFGAVFFGFLFKYPMKHIMLYISNIGLIIVSLIFMLTSNSTHFAAIECLIFLLGFFGIGPSSLPIQILSQANSTLCFFAAANSLLYFLTGFLQLMSSITINYLSHEKLDIETKAFKYNFWIPMIIENLIAAISITFHKF